MLRALVTPVLVVFLCLGTVPAAAQPLPEAQRRLLPLGLEVEGRPVTRPEDVLFYGPRVPRVHRHGLDPVSERHFFEIAGDEEAARRSRNHRAINITLSTLSILGFFSGLALFGAADEVDLGLFGLPPETQGRVLSIGLVGGSLVPATLAMLRGNHWAPLEYSYQTMRAHNEAVRE
ncbi:MAG: hypothetical protein ACOCU4_03285 [Alkalispirochaeta sp.]